MMTFMWLMNFGFIMFVSIHFKYEMTKAYFEKHVIEKNLKNIIDNLEEAIITKTQNGIGFCNILGFKILDEIYRHETNY